MYSIDYRKYFICNQSNTWYRIRPSAKYCPLFQSKLVICWLIFVQYKKETHFMEIPFIKVSLSLLGNQ